VRSPLTALRPQAKNRAVQISEPEWRNLTGGRNAPRFSVQSREMVHRWVTHTASLSAFLTPLLEANKDNA